MNNITLFFNLFALLFIYKEARHLITADYINQTRKEKILGRLYMVWSLVGVCINKGILFYCHFGIIVLSLAGTIVVGGSLYRFACQSVSKEVLITGIPIEVQKEFFIIPDVRRILILDGIISIVLLICIFVVSLISLDFAGNIK